MDSSSTESVVESDAAAPLASETQPAASSDQAGENAAPDRTVAAHPTTVAAQETAPSLAVAAAPSAPPIVLPSDPPKSSRPSSFVPPPERISAPKAALKQPGSPLPRTRSPNAPLWRRIDPFHAAGAAVALGLGWIIGANTLDDRADVARLHAEVSMLHNQVAAIETVAARVPRSAEIKALRESEARLGATVRAQNVRMEVTSRAAQVRLAQTESQIDHIQKDTGARIDQIAKDTRLDQVTARLARLEHQVSSSLATASIASAVPKPAPPEPPVSKVKEEAAPAPTTPSASASASIPAPRASARQERDESDAADDEQRPARPSIPATGYVLRDVYRGVALVQSRSGLREVAPGDRLPGAGRVERIVKRDGSWVVVTSDGIIDQNNY